MFKRRPNLFLFCIIFLWVIFIKGNSISSEGILTVRKVGASEKCTGDYDVYFYHIPDYSFYSGVGFTFIRVSKEGYIYIPPTTIYIPQGKTKVFSSNGEFLKEISLTLPGWLQSDTVRYGGFRDMQISHTGHIYFLSWIDSYKRNGIKGPSVEVVLEMNEIGDFAGIWGKKGQGVSMWEQSNGKPWTGADFFKIFDTLIIWNNFAYTLGGRLLGNAPQRYCVDSEDEFLSAVNGEVWSVKIIDSLNIYIKNLADTDSGKICFSKDFIKHCLLRINNPWYSDNITLEREYPYLSSVKDQLETCVRKLQRIPLSITPEEMVIYSVESSDKDPFVHIIKHVLPIVRK